MGFTLSEVMTLLAAALVLALAVIMGGIARERDLARNEAENCKRQLESAPECPQRLAAVARELNVESSPDEIDDLFIELRLVKEKADKWDKVVGSSGLTEKEVAARLEEADESKAQREAEKAKAAKWDTVVKALPGVSESTLVARANEIRALLEWSAGATPELALGECEKNLVDAKKVADYWVAKAEEKAGRGGLDFPPCWTVPASNKPVYIFEVDIADDGLLVKDLTGERRSELEEVGLDLSLFNGKQTPAMFTAKTRGVLNASKQANCRHFVRVTDTTTTKAAYKAMLQIVEGTFYRYEMQPSPAQSLKAPAGTPPVAQPQSPGPGNS